MTLCPLCAKRAALPQYGICMDCLLDRNPDVTEEMILLEIDDQDDQDDQE